MSRQSSLHLYRCTWCWDMIALKPKDTPPTWHRDHQDGASHQARYEYIGTIQVSVLTVLEKENVR